MLAHILILLSTLRDLERGFTEVHDRVVDLLKVNRFDDLLVNHADEGGPGDEVTCIRKQLHHVQQVPHLLQ